MDSSDTPEIPPPASTFSHQLPFHHHHHFELSPHCPQHGGYLLRPNSHHHLQLSSDCPLHGHLLPPCQLHTSNFRPNNHPFPIIPNFSSTPNPNFNSVPAEAEIDTNRNEEEEDEIIFVLTDEWKEFFAKSEAKRRLAKKQAKNKGKGKD